jgi:colanic acid biosynthesis protein WcaH
VELVPLLTVDVILKYGKKYILVKRKNEPLKGYYWILGGRVLKGENADDGARRKIYEELGIKIKNVKFFGYYEEHYKKSAWGVTSHTTSLVFTANTESIEKFKLDDQSSNWILDNKLPPRFLRHFHKI